MRFLHCWVSIDGDGQHPPALIPELIRSWEDGNKVVVGVRTVNKNEGAIKKYGSKLFYWLLNKDQHHDTV